MAKINIMGVATGSKNFTVHVVLTEERDIEGSPVDVPLGEAFLDIPEATEMADVKARIVDASQAIMKKHQDSMDKRKDIEEMDFPPIE